MDPKSALGGPKPISRSGARRIYVNWRGLRREVPEGNLEAGLQIFKVIRRLSRW